MAYAVFDGNNVCVGLSEVGTVVATAENVGSRWNGTSWVGSFYSDYGSIGSIGNNRKIYFFGDSISAACFNAPGTTANSITVLNGVCTLDLGGAFDPLPGMRVMIDSTADPELNMRMCTITAALTRNKFSFVVDGYTPPDGTIAKSSASNISFLYLNSRSVLNPVTFANGKLGGYFEFNGVSARNGYRVDELYQWFFSRFNQLDIGFALFSMGVNSINAADTYGTPQQIWAQMQEMLDYCVTKGVVPIIRTCPSVQSATWPRADGRYYKLCWLNNKIRKWAADNAGYALLMDTHKTTVDPASATAEPKTGFTTDGLHPSSKCAQVDGIDLAKNLTNLLGYTGYTHSNVTESIYYTPSQLDDYNSANAAGFTAFALQMLTNPALRGTAGTAGTGITGSVPDNWTLNRQGASGAGTTTLSSDANGNGTISVAITATANDDGINLFQSGLHTQLNLNTGKNVRFGLKLNASSMTLLKELRTSVYGTVAGDESGSSFPFQRIMGNNQTTSASSLDNLSGDYVFVSEPMLLSRTLTAAQFDLTVTFYAGGSGTLVISEPFLIVEE